MPNREGKSTAIGEWSLKLQSFRWNRSLFGRFTGQCHFKHCSKNARALAPETDFRNIVTVAESNGRGAGFDLPMRQGILINEHALPHGEFA
jgi:hypothetical protein